MCPTVARFVHITFLRDGEVHGELVPVKKRIERFADVVKGLILALGDESCSHRRRYQVFGRNSACGARRHAIHPVRANPLLAFVNERLFSASGVIVLQQRGLVAHACAMIGVDLLNKCWILFQQLVVFLQGRFMFLSCEISHHHALLRSLAVIISLGSKGLDHLVLSNGGCRNKQSVPIGVGGATNRLARREVGRVHPRANVLHDHIDVTMSHHREDLLNLLVQSLIRGEPSSKGANDCLVVNVKEEVCMFLDLGRTRESFHRSASGVCFTNDDSLVIEPMPFDRLAVLLSWRENELLSISHLGTVNGGATGIANVSVTRGVRYQRWLFTFRLLDGVQILLSLRVGEDAEGLRITPNAIRYGPEDHIDNSLKFAPTSLPGNVGQTV